MYIEVKKKSGGKYEVTPNVTPSGGSPLNQVVYGFQGYYGADFFIDENNNTLKIENVATFDYSVVYTIFLPGDYNDSVYHRGTDFDELIYEEEESERRVYLYKNGEIVTDFNFEGQTSTSEFTIAQVLGIN